MWKQRRLVFLEFWNNLKSSSVFGEELLKFCLVLLLHSSNRLKFYNFAFWFGKMDWIVRIFKGLGVDLVVWTLFHWWALADSAIVSFRLNFLLLTLVVSLLRFLFNLQVFLAPWMSLKCNPKFEFGNVMIAMFSAMKFYFSLFSSHVSCNI